MFLYLSLVFLHYAVWFSEFPHHPSPNCVEQLIALAMTGAQKEQMKIEVQGTEAQRLEDNEKASSKLEKAQATLDKFTSNEKVLGPDWKVIIAYILPQYKPAEKLAAYQTIPKIQAKLEELEKEKGTTWALFMAEDILKSRANLQLADPGKDLENLDEEVDPSLYGATMEA